MACDDSQQQKAQETFVLSKSENDHKNSVQKSLVVYSLQMLLRIALHA